MFRYYFTNCCEKTSGFLWGHFNYIMLKGYDGTIAQWCQEQTAHPSFTTRLNGSASVSVACVMPYAQKHRRLASDPRASKTRYCRCDHHIPAPNGYMYLTEDSLHVYVHWNQLYNVDIKIFICLSQQAMEIWKEGEKKNNCDPTRVCDHLQICVLINLITILLL